MDKASFSKKSPSSIIQRTQTLSKGEVDAIEQYTRSDDYADLNAYLRAGNTGNAYFDNETKLLKSAISKTQTSESITVWRGVSSGELRKYNIDSESLSLDAFTSTSLSRSVAEKFAGDDLKNAVVYKINLPKGTHAIDAMGISTKPDER